MQIKRMAKKLAAMSAGALMLGATLTGALAYNLADYPAPFVKNGVLDNTVLVVGAKAATSDVVGAIDVAAALQAEAVTSVPIEGGLAEATVTEGVKIEKSGTKYIYGATLGSVQTAALDDTDLPVMLKEEDFKDTKGANKGTETYQQSLMLNTATDSGSFLFDQPDDMDAGSYVEILKGDDIYEYTLEFDAPVEYDVDAASADLEGNAIKIQGNTYTITEAKLDTNDVLDYLKLVAGDSTVWLAQDQPYTVGEHTVTVVNVDENGESCGVNVDGETLWIDEGSTEELGGMSIGVIDVKVVHAKDYDQDTCELTLGSNELILEQDEPVKVNNVEMQGSNVDFDVDGVANNDGEFEGFMITYEAGQEDDDVNLLNSDDIFLAPGGAWTDPVFGNFKIVYAGVAEKTEDLKFKSTGDDATLTFTNNEGDEVVIPWHYDGTSMFLGHDDEEPLMVFGDDTTSLGFTLTDVEGVRLLYSTSGDEVHVLEITDLDCNSAPFKIEIEDLTAGGSSTETLTNCDGATTDSISLPVGDLDLVIDDTYVEFVNTAGKGDGLYETKYEGYVTLPNSSFEFEEKDGDETAAETVTVTLAYDEADDEKIEISDIAFGVGTLSWEDETDGNDEVQAAITEKGSLLTYDDEDDLWLDMTHPEEDVYAEVFVAPVKGEVISGGSSATADKVNPFAVGLAVLDEQAESMTKNMIVVGGPCANTVAFGLLNPTNCADGFEEGKAMLKFFDRKGKAALLVAGYDAQDTVNAAYVLAQHNKKYASKFTTLKDEVELVVTDMDQVVFKTA